jgi:hypothetical protein
MDDSGIPSRFRLLWEGYSSVPKGEPFTLDGDIPKKAGYEALGPRYVRIVRMDINLLQYREKAINPVDTNALVAYEPYQITDRGLELLRGVGYPV